MKIEVLPMVPPVSVIAVESVRIEKYYGVCFGGSKGFIKQQKYRFGDFAACCRDSVTIGNNWPQTKTPELSTTIERCFALGMKVYQFDSADELFKFLAE